MTRKIALLAAVLFALFVGLNAAVAQDPEAGAKLAKRCTCHKSRGDLEGMPADEFAAKMNSYKAGEGNKGMVKISQKLEDSEIADLAAYYASQPKK